MHQLQEAKQEMIETVAGFLEERPDLLARYPAVAEDFNGLLGFKKQILPRSTPATGHHGRHPRPSSETLTAIGPLGLPE